MSKIGRNILRGIAITVLSPLWLTAALVLVPVVIVVLIASGIVELTNFAFGLDPGK